MGRERTHIVCVKNPSQKAEIAENLKEFFPELGDLSYDELLEHQEGLYQSLNEFDRNKDMSVPTSGHVGESSWLGNSNSQIELDEEIARFLMEKEFDELNISQPTRTEIENIEGSSRETPVTESFYQWLTDDNYTPVPTSDWSQRSGHVRESSRLENSNSQLELDEAFARSLLEEEFDELNISQPSGFETENRAGSSRETSITPANQTAAQGDIDPDNMTYEQLQSLGEAIGSVSNGLSQARISKLPSSKYRNGWLSSKENEPPECVICCMPFKNGDTVTTLRCSHQYHSECIKKWLKLKKQCPICQREVV